MTAAVPAPTVVTRTELKVDLGCGTRKMAGFVGADICAFEGVDLVINLARDRWPWEDGTVTEANACHFVEHLDDHAVDLKQTTRELEIGGETITVVTHVELVRLHERVHFFNELYRVLAPGAKCVIQTPYWASTRAYGDPSHVWPAVAEFSYYYLDAEWRRREAPHDADLYTCDFHTSWGFVPSQDLLVRSTDYQQFALANYKDAALDLVATVTKK